MKTSELKVGERYRIVRPKRQGGGFREVVFQGVSYDHINGTPEWALKEIATGKIHLLASSTRIRPLEGE